MEDPTARRAWDTALGQLQLQVTRPNFDTWLKDTRGLVAENGTFVVGTPSDFVSEWLSAKMGPVIAKTVSSVLGRDVTVRFQVITCGDTSNGDLPNPQPMDAGAPSQPAPTRRSWDRRLNSTFTFEHFIAGDCNRLALASSLAAAETPGAAYNNPLFIYGPCGVGKTHLLHSIGHRAAKAGHVVLYTTSEQFTNEFVASISQGKQEAFRRRHRSVDLLLIDDIQFLVGKERTQEEFFHTFNDLHAAACQLVVTCDRSPKEINGVGSRLSSRFQWGLIADVCPPDQDTRMAILQAKARHHRIPLAPVVADFLADTACDSVRELEGLLNRVAAYARLTRSAITIDVARRALLPLSPSPVSSPPDPQAIITGVARYYHLSPQAITGPSRAKPVAEARHIAMYLLREDAQLPLKAIGRLLGGRDHSTVIHGCRKATSSLTSANSQHQLAEIRSLIFS